MTGAVSRNDSIACGYRKIRSRWCKLSIFCWGCCWASSDLPFLHIFIYELTAVLLLKQKSLSRISIIETFKDPYFHVLLCMTIYFYTLMYHAKAFSIFCSFYTLTVAAVLVIFPSCMARSNKCTAKPTEWQDVKERTEGGWGLVLTSGNSNFISLLTPSIISCISWSFV